MLWYRLVLAMCFLVALTTKARAQQTPVFGDAEEIANDFRMRAALNRTVNWEFVETPLSDVAAWLQETLGVEVQLDHRALEDVGSGSDTPVTFHCKALPASDALGLLLTKMDLTWLNHRAVLITTPEKASSEIVTRVYPVADLITVTVEDDKGESVPHDYDSLIELVTTTVEPATWDEVGGPGSIAPFETGLLLVVSQTARMHAKIEQLFLALRGARDAQGIPIHESVGSGEPVVQRIWQQPAYYPGLVGTAAEPESSAHVAKWQVPRRHE